MGNLAKISWKALGGTLQQFLPNLPVLSLFYLVVLQPLECSWYSIIPIYHLSMCAQSFSVKMHLVVKSLLMASPKYTLFRKGSNRYSSHYPTGIPPQIHTKGTTRRFEKRIFISVAASIRKIILLTHADIYQLLFQLSSIHVQQPGRLLLPTSLRLLKCVFQGCNSTSQDAPMSTEKFASSMPYDYSAYNIDICWVDTSDLFPIVTRRAFG